MVNVEPQNLQIEQPQQQQQNQNQTPQHRACRTHLNDHVSLFLSKLQLHDRLSMNKEIEEKNRERETKTLKHMQDPLAHPEPGSETASLLTIDEEDINDLKDQTMFAKFLSVLSNSLIQRITRENRHEKEEREKRKRDDNSKTHTDKSLGREVKHRCMDGDKAAERIIGSQNSIEFSEIMYTTDNYAALPLTFFRKNLRHIIDHGATLPTIKSNPREGESKGCYILDITKLINI